MKFQLPTQLIVLIVIVAVGGGGLVGEYFLVRWYPIHEQHVAEKTLRLWPYRNDSLDISMQIAAGIYGRVENFPGGVRIRRWKLFGPGPSLTITTQPNPDGAFEFSPQILARWQAQGVTDNLPDYNFEHVKINNRDAAIIWQRKGRIMFETAYVISPERIIEAACSPGAETDENLYLQACDETLHTIQVAGPQPSPAPHPALEEVEPGH